MTTATSSPDGRPEPGSPQDEPCRPIVSIIVCTRNRGARLGGTLRSLAELKSDHAWEALLVDNASSDDTAEVIGSADDCGGRLRYLHVGRIGLGAARDASWRQAAGDIVCFTDDDCYLRPDFVDAIVQVFQERPDAGCVGGRILLYDPDDAPVTIDEREQASSLKPFSFVRAGALQGANLSFRRKVLEDIGGVDPDLGAGTPFPCEDIDAVAAAVWRGQTALFDPRPVVFHHHGRRAADVGRLNQSYDRGRGAYYAKYLLRGDTRLAYLQGWWALTMARRGSARLSRLARELASAFGYLRARRKILAMIVGGVVGIGAYGAIGAVTMAQALGQRRSRPV